MLKYAQLFDMKRIGNGEQAVGKAGKEGALRRPLILHHEITHPASYSTTTFSNENRKLSTNGHERTHHASKTSFCAFPRGLRRFAGLPMVNKQLLLLLEIA
jgi:hypothetical protein